MILPLLKFLQQCLIEKVFKTLREGRWEMTVRGMTHHHHRIKDVSFWESAASRLV